MARANKEVARQIKDLRKIEESIRTASDNLPELINLVYKPYYEQTSNLLRTATLAINEAISYLTPEN